MSHTPVDSHFIGDPKIELLGHRPHKTAKMVFQAITATAIFRIWPTLLFFGGWSTAIVLINKKTSAELTVPSTMLTVLGVLLGLTLSYRTSSAYDRYWEGRRMWSQIILGARTWSRMVWIHCPDSLVVAVPEGTEPNPHDESQAILEKYTMVQMSLAFAVAVKHYLRGEEGILYDDLYHLVRFIPSLNLPSGIPSSSDANNAIGPAYSRHVLRQSSVETDIEGGTTSSTSNDEKLSSHQDPHLHPARQPPVFRWSETFPFSLFLSSHQKAKVAQRKMYRRKMKEVRQGGGVGHNVPLGVTLFMSCWIAQMQKRKTIDVPTINALLAAVQSMSDALISLERILTTPIPWSYNAHIWEVTWVYCLLLPFQLYGAGFNWVTVPAVVITTYIVVGFAEIGSEIENPFGYDANDLNLDFFVNDIIKKELDAITARPFAPPEDWVFSATNVVGKAGEGKHAAQMQYPAADRVSDILQNRSRSTGDDGMRHRARSPV